MTQLDGMPDESYLEKLRTKWGLEDGYRSNIAAMVCENQSRHLQRLVEETRALVLGSWTEDLFDNLKASVRTHVLPDLCAVQPMTGPIGIVYYYKPRFGEMEEATLIQDGVERKVKVPSVVLDIIPQEIRAESRRCKAHTDVNEEGALNIDALLTEVAREIVGTILNGVLDNNKIELAAGGDLKEALDRAAHIVHRGSQRNPANRVIGNAAMLAQLGFDVQEADGIAKIGEVDGRGVYLDPLFPVGKLLAWYQADDSVMDTCVIYSPYTMVEITPNFVDPADKTLRRAIRTRHKITLVRPEFASLITLAGTPY